MAYQKEKYRKGCSCILAILALTIVWTSSISIIQLPTTNYIVGAAYAQLEPQSPAPSAPFIEWYEAQKNNPKSNVASIKILSPEKGQQVPAGQGLVVTGTSTDNSTTDCRVSVIVNGQKPYQRTVANGSGGAQDFSSWNFLIRPTYATIEEGPANKITSKLECEPNFTKWYSVNVTGVEGTAIGSREGNAPQSPIVPSPPRENRLPLNVTETSTFSTDSTGRPSKSLLISLNLSSDSVESGDDQTIEAEVFDPVSHLPIEDAELDLVVTDSSGTPVEEFSDDDGNISYTFEVGSGNEDEGETTPREYKATIRASAAGYAPESISRTFTLIEPGGDAGGTETVPGDATESPVDRSDELFE